MKNLKFLFLYITGFSLVTLIVSSILGVDLIASGKSNYLSSTPNIPRTPNPTPTLIPFSFTKKENNTLALDFPSWGRERTKQTEFLLMEKNYDYYRYVDNIAVDLGNRIYGIVSRVIPLNMPIAPGVVNFIDFYLQTNCNKDFNYSFYGAIVNTEGTPSVWRECSTPTCSNIFYFPDHNALKKIVEITCRNK